MSQSYDYRVPHFEHQALAECPSKGQDLKMERGRQIKPTGENNRSV